MKKLKALDILKEVLLNTKGLKQDGFFFGENKIKEAIKELQQLEIIVDDKRTLKDYVFTNCNDCKNKIDNKFTEICFKCKRYHGCYFELKGN